MKQSIFGSAVKTLLRRVTQRLPLWFCYGLRNDTEYGPVFPVARYSPWTQDTKFLAVYEAIRKHSLVDVYRCWELWTLVEQVAHVSGALIEIGVWRGGTSALIAKRAAGLGITDPIYMCDTFRGVVKAGTLDTAYVGSEHADTSIQIVRDLLRDLDVERMSRILSGIFPEETGPAVASETFRLCHIDVDVYQSARDVLEWVWPRLQPGGVVVFDDYGFVGCDGVRRLVNEYATCHDRIYIHNLNGHAIFIKR